MFSFSALPCPVTPSPSFSGRVKCFPLVFDPALAGDDSLDDLDVLTGTAPWLLDGTPYQPSETCGPRGPESEDEATPPEGVDRHTGHRGRRGLAGGHLKDRGAELDPLGLRREVGEDADRVGAIGLADQTESKPRRSAAWTISVTSSAWGPIPQ